ncbi:acyltransferase [Flavobacterium sp.]|uniref:acyltransferase n=1 Tax=Flavobacterium sp. TaxID=239 RepID=UPI0039E57EEB
MRNRILNFWFVTLRIVKFRWLSDCRNVSGQPKLYHPLLLKGKGRIVFGKDVQIGVIASPGYFSHYTYVEARNEDSQVIFGDRVAVNNNFSVLAFSKITIGDDVLIGVNCSIIDSDAHQLDADKRNTGVPVSRDVLIGQNVFLGNDVTVLKGVTIGRNSVIGNGSVVTRDVPENVIAAGNPAVVIRKL